MNEDRSQQASPTRLSGVSGSSPGSVVAGTPLEVKPQVFEDLFEAALAFNILQPIAVMEIFPPIRVFDAMKDEPERVADIVHKLIGTKRSVVLARFDPQRYAEDIEAGIKDDPTLAKIFIDTVGMDFFQKAMGPKEIYTVVIGNYLGMKDVPAARGFAAQCIDILVKHSAFGSEVQTLHAIEKAIGLDVLFGDKTPEALRIRMIKAINKGCRSIKTEYICEYMFESQMGGVSFLELAQHLPLDVIGTPFAVYIDRTGLMKTDVAMESVLPPASDDLRTSAFSVPRPPYLPPPPPKTTL